MKETAWTKENLWALRKESPLCSLFYRDYKNTFGVEIHACLDFFDGYASYLEERMADAGISDAMFFEHLNEFDTPDNLYDWYSCFEEEPLVLEDEDCEYAA